MSTTDLVSCPAVMAIELPQGEVPNRNVLERDEAEQLAAFMAEDLHALLPGVEAARLAVVGAHFDSTELLRPGFPVFATLTGLSERVDGDVVAFGARDRHMPAQPLVPDQALTGGALRLVPFTLLAKPEVAAGLSATIEQELAGQGEVGQRTADYLMRQLGVQMEHARYFSRADLMALVCVHYEHVNLMSLWALVEGAILTPERAESHLSAHGLTWRQQDGRAIAQSPGDWLAQVHVDAAERPHALAGIVFELRQYAALLAAHHVEVGFDGAWYEPGQHVAIDRVAERDGTLPAPTLFAHEAAGLGIIALTVAQPGRLLAHAWLVGRDLEAACHQLAERYGCASKPQKLGRIVFDDKGQLAAPR
ncbi:MAG TPA: hypothetical protein VF271_03570 [Rhodanobacteraceae bacterium]